MPALELRPYQAAAVERLEAEWASGRRRALLVMATGTGKTIVIAECVRRAVAAGGRCLVLAHRGELLDQAADKIGRATGLSCSVEKAEETSEGSWCRVIVGSVQSMAGRRLGRFSPGAFDLVVVDEAHHAVSDTYRRVLDHFAGARVLGVTATADRADKRDLGEAFDAVAFEYGIADAVADGWLCPIKAQTLPVSVDLTGAPVTAGDYSADAVATALDPYLAAIASQMGTVCAGRKSVVFTPLVATAKKLVPLLAAAGIEAREVDGQSADRAEALAWFDQAGPGTAIVNSMLLTEGWDCPSVDCVVPLRGTKSRALFCQMAGRGTRLSPATGKTDLLLLDFLWQTLKHDLCRPAHLVAQDPDVAEAATAVLEGRSAAPEQAALDLMAVERAARSDVVREREERLAEELAAQRRKKARLVDPLQYAFSVKEEALTSFEPAMGWEAGPVGADQAEALERSGVNPEGVRCAGEAAAIIESLERRRALDMATPKQIRLLERYGFRDVGEWGRRAASAMIGRISAGGWRVPARVDPATYHPDWNPQ